MNFYPYKNLVGEFSENDGTIDFYLRINSLLEREFTVLDLGAGRASWFEDDLCETRRNLRLLKGKVQKVIASDVDEVVLENRASDEQIVMRDGVLNIEENSVDLIIADYVLEHVADPQKFVLQVQKLLKSGGWFCARTPHKYCYVAIAASVVSNAGHARLLKGVQPGRKEVDVFPTVYKLNTMRDIKNNFYNWNNKSFIFRSDPAYFFNSKILFKIQSAIHRIMPKYVCGNLFVFLQKP